MARDIKIEDYTYDLPPDKIAKAPLSNRSDSKLLVYKNGSIEDAKFKDIVSYLPSNCSLVFNNTKVVCARLLFDNPGISNKPIEIFVLEPTAGLTIEQAMLQKGTCSWICLIGNMRHFSVDSLEKSFHAHNSEFKLTAFKPLPSGDAFEVRFDWDGDISFAELLNLAGIIPLPPYLKRIPDENDKTRYQTIYAKQEGSVAAPTAGLHFTEEVFARLRAKGIQEAEVTLHVSAGTFQPIKVTKVQDHPMHSEQLDISIETVDKLARHTGKIVAVGTTSVRTLESLYWYGVKLIEEGEKSFEIEKLAPYRKRSQLPSRKEALEAVKHEMERTSSTSILGTTEIFLIPGYKFQLVDALITNFHQPGSTLILLIASILGQDWKKVYEEALEKEYRFLSYGDSSLLWI